MRHGHLLPRPQPDPRGDLGEAAKARDGHGQKDRPELPRRRRQKEAGEGRPDELGRRQKQGPPGGGAEEDEKPSDQKQDDAEEKKGEE